LLSSEFVLLPGAVTRVELAGLGLGGGVVVLGRVGLVSLGVLCAMPKPLAKGAAFVELEGVGCSSELFIM